MNKRIKRKIMNRSFKKLMTGEKLSVFETKYLAQLVKRTIKVDICTENKLVSSYVEDNYPHPIEVKSTLPSQLRATEKSEQAHQDAIDSLKYAVLANDKPIIVRHPSKWEKVKSKVKRWLGK